MDTKCVRQLVNAGRLCGGGDRHRIQGIPWRYTHSSPMGSVLFRRLDNVVNNRVNHARHGELPRGGLRRDDRIGRELEFGSLSFGLVTVMPRVRITPTSAESTPLALGSAARVSGR